MKGKKEGSVKNRPKTPSQKDEKTPFQRFEELAKRIVSVPKEKIKEHKPKRALS
jgi:hypothetical protein